MPQKRVLAAALCAAVVAACGPEVSLPPPDQVMIHLMINTDDSKGPETRAIQLVDLDTDKAYTFPLSALEGGAVDGQPMHALIAPDRMRAWMTVGGDDKLPLRMVALELTWTKTGPKVKVVGTEEVIPANTPNKAGKITQQGHGTRFGADDRFIYFASSITSASAFTTRTTTSWWASPSPTPCSRRLTAST